jgi:hypothetical protein
MPPLDRKYYESKVKNFDEANATGEVDSQLMEYLFVASIEIAKAMSDIENTPLREAILETFKYFVEANRSVKKGFFISSAKGMTKRRNKETGGITDPSKEDLTKMWNESKEDRALALMAENFDIDQAFKEYKKGYLERKKNEIFEEIEKDDIMTMEAKRLQHKINVVKKKIKRIRNKNKLQTYVDVKEKPELVAENKRTNSIWSWVKDKFW